MLAALVSCRLANEQLVGNASSLRGELDAANRRIGVLIRESDDRLKELERAKEAELRYGPRPPRTRHRAPCVLYQSTAYECECSGTSTTRLVLSILVCSIQKCARFSSFSDLLLLLLLLLLLPLPPSPFSSPQVHENAFEAYG